MSAPEPDKSPKGGIDAPIVPVLDALNANPSYFTTSSCSGRISILSHASANKSKSKKKAGGGGWIFVSHDPADPDAVVGLLFEEQHHPPGGTDAGSLVFRFEPLIIAVECRDAAAAQALVATAISCGFRESGITSIHKRTMVAIRCSIRLEVPLGQIGSILVSPEYVRYLVGVANEKMEANRRRTDGFLHILQYKGLPAFEQEKTVSYRKGESLLADRKTLSDCEAKQNDILLKTTVLEAKIPKSHSQDNIFCYVKNNNDSESARCSGEANGTDASGNSLEVSDNCEDLEVGYCNKQIIDMDPNSELPGSSVCSLSVDMLGIVGEPIEKLFIWGQSACTLKTGGQEQIIVFGGFGGLGRHARINYALMLDPHTGLLIEIDAIGPPSPRLGHTSSVVGDHVFIIGGRGGPTQILNEVWVLDRAENKWMLLECTGSMFHPRHRHAAAAVGPNIYIFGGLNNEVIYSSMLVLNTEKLQWSEVSIHGEWPHARHSHSLVANDTQLYMFGGFDGEKALGDLYSFDVRMLVWKKEETTGRAPYPRFSHSMFIYNKFLGIIGGCPVRQQYQELSLLNLDYYVWMHVTIDSIGRSLWVRSSTCVVGDNLVIVGGGVSCYAFGTKFNEPMKINLHSLESTFDIPSNKENKPLKQNCKANGNQSSQWENHLRDTSHSSDQDTGLDISTNGDMHCPDDKHLFLRLEKKYAKLAKDILKRSGWLDLTRKVQRSQDALHICLPIYRNFSNLYQKEHYFSDRVSDGFNNFEELEASARKWLSENEVSVPMALNYLLACGDSLLIDDISCSRKISKAPQKIMRELVSSLLREKGMPPQLLEQLPTRWERLGDIVVLPVTSFKDPKWDSIGQELWSTVAKSLGAQRLARQGRISPTGTRDSTLEILIGDNGWVTHQENGILYSFDTTKCMFSSGNLSEKLRMANLNCRDEVIVDLFAGIGYFVLPFLVKAKAEMVYACEWNPHALKALQHNVNANLVSDRCIILEGDNCVTAPKGVAHRVCLGLLPSSERSWATAVRTLRAEGGILHVHENVMDSKESSWLEYLVKSIGDIAQSEGLYWDVSVQHLERVKWYGPHIRHLVADVRCRQLET